MKRDTGKRIAGFLLVITIVACGPPGPVKTGGPEGPILTVVPQDRWPDLTDDSETAPLIEAARISKTYFDARPPERVFSFSEEQRTAAELSVGLEKFIKTVASTAPESRNTALKEHFILLRSIGRDGQGEVFFTGYFEPLLEGRRQPGGKFTHPLFRTPTDLLTIKLDEFGVECSRSRLRARIENNNIVPYWDRDAIDFQNKLEGKAETLAYLDDPVSAFFLHVQGSGTITFKNGDRIRAGYATTNGQPYRSIGKLLIDDGLVSIEEMSMQAIVQFLKDHPDELRRVLTANPSYVFFRALPADDGPLGCYEKPLTEGRSIATDNRLFPGPVVAWIKTTVPSLEGEDESFTRFMLNQDTGGSIRGPGRVDIFYGLGDEPGELAGRTKHTGELFFLLPKAELTPRVQ